MNKTLTPAERAIINQLKEKVGDTGCFGEMMKAAFTSNKPEAVKQLLADIKYQSYYAPASTAKMLGFETFMMIVNL